VPTTPKPKPKRNVVVAVAAAVAVDPRFVGVVLWFDSKEWVQTDQQVVPEPAFVVVVAAAVVVVVDCAIEMGVGTTCFAGRAAVGPSLKTVVALAEQKVDWASVDGLGRELKQQHAVAAAFAAAVVAAFAAAVVVVAAAVVVAAVVVAAAVVAVAVVAAELELLHSWPCAQGKGDWLVPVVAVVAAAVVVVHWRVAVAGVAVVDVSVETRTNPWVAPCDRHLLLHHPRLPVVAELELAPVQGVRVPG
jgi:hypothetical protein